MLGGVLQAQRAVTVSTLVTPPALAGSPPWTLCRPLGGTFCSGPRSQSGLGLLHSLAPGPCACQGQPLDCACRGCVCPGQPGSELRPGLCTGPSPGETLGRVPPVAFPGLEMGVSAGSTASAGLSVTSDIRPPASHHLLPRDPARGPHPARLPWGTGLVGGPPHLVSRASFTVPAPVDTLLWKALCLWSRGREALP